MLKKIAKLIDVKSIITIGLVITLIVVTLFNTPVEEKVFNLFSNVLTMVMTYFFTKKSDKSK
jgi:uncharacterized protein YacL